MPLFLGNYMVDITDIFKQKIILVTQYSEDEKAEIRQIVEYIEKLLEQKRQEQSNDIQT